MLKNYTIHVHKNPESRLAGAKADPNAGFGKHYTDHMIVADLYAEDWEDEYAIVTHAELRPYGDIALSPACNGLHYSQAAFEGMLCFADAEGKLQLFRPREHMHRLNVSAQRMGLPRIREDFFMEALGLLLTADAAWIDRNQGHSLYIRPILFANEPQLGVQTESKHFKLLIIMTLNAGYRTGALNLYVPRMSAAGDARAYVRASIGGTGAVKASANYGGTIEPLRVAQRQGSNEVLWLGAQNPDLIEEAGTSNVFFVVGDRVLTPRLDGAILPGITRDSVIKLLQVMGHEVEEKDISFSDLLAAGEALTEAFATGTASSVKPILRIDSAERVIELEPLALAQRLREALLDVQWRRVVDGFGWMKGVGN